MSPERGHRIRGVLRGLAVIAGVTLGVAGCGSSSTYSVDEVVASFARSGYPLVVIELPRGSPAAIGGRALRPREGGDVMVFVGSDAAAREAWADFVRVGSDADSFSALRANVMVVSDGGLSSQERRRIRDALGELPDRGDPVRILSQETA
jgi:hypothetical protein